MAKLGASPRLERVATAIDTLSETGKVCVKRALLEAERRFCGNKTEEITGTPLVFSNRELICTLLDPRTKAAAHLDTATKRRALELLCNALVAFTLTAEKNLAAQMEARKAAEAAKEAARNEAPPPERVRIAGAAGWEGLLVSPERAPAPPAQRAPVPAASEENRWAKREAEIKLRAPKLCSAWLQYSIDWCAEFPELAEAVPAPAAPSAAPAAPSAQLDPLHDLFNLPIGRLLKKIIDQEGSFKQFGYLPLMAGCSAYNIAAQQFNSEKGEIN